MLYLCTLWAIIPWENSIMACICHASWCSTTCVKLLQIPIIKGFFVPFIHVCISLFGIVSRSRTQAIHLVVNISFACPEWRNINLFLASWIIVVFLINWIVQLIWLIICSWAKVMIAISRNRLSNNFSWSLMTVGINTYFFLLFLYCSLQNKNIIRSSSW